MISFPRRGEIWLVRLDPMVGSEIKKTRPALIVSNDINNQHAHLATILPISDKGLKVYPFEVAISEGISGLSKPSKIKCQQIRIIDKERLIKKLGTLEKEFLQDVEEALKLHLAMKF